MVGVFVFMAPIPSIINLANLHDHKIKINILTKIARISKPSFIGSEVSKHEINCSV